MSQRAIFEEPALVKMCLNCKRARCPHGTCPEYEQKRREYAGTRGQGKPPGLYELNGERRTLNEWATRYGLPSQLLRVRMSKGATLAEAIEMGNKRRVALHTVDGESLTVSGWAERSGVRTEAFRQFMRDHNATVAEAVAYYAARAERKGHGHA